MGLPQIKRCIALTEPKAFAGIPMIQLLGRLSGVLRPIPMRLTARGPALPGEIRLERLLDETHPPVPTQKVAPEDTALVTFTTGSTGIPKGANRTHRFINAQGFATGEDFFAFLKDAFDVLYAEGERAPKMMSVGLHCRLAGRPGRAAGLVRFLDYLAAHERVWVARRLDIARHWHREHRAVAARAPTVA